MKKKKKNVPAVEKIVQTIQTYVFDRSVKAGDYLPSERQWAEDLCVSRPTIHEALLILESRGLVAIKPRHGAMVTDFENNTSLALLIELYKHKKIIQTNIIEKDLQEFRQLILTDVIKKCISRYKLLPTAKKKTFYTETEQYIAIEKNEPIDEVIRKDFLFYSSLITLAENSMYMFFFTEAKEIYLYQLKRFFVRYPSARIKIPQYKTMLIKTLKKSMLKKSIDILISLTSVQTYRRGVDEK